MCMVLISRVIRSVYENKNQEHQNIAFRVDRYCVLHIFLYLPHPPANESNQEQECGWAMRVALAYTREEALAVDDPFAGY